MARRFPLPAVMSAALVAAAGMATAPALATTVLPTGTGSSSSVIVLLDAPNPAGLDRLAAAHGLSHAQRVSALDALLPSAATHSEVVSQLRGAGFTVTAQTAWTISASAAASTVASTFGTAAAVPSDATDIERARARTTLPTVPASLAGLAAAALPTTGGPNLLSPLEACNGCLDGTDFRNAYTSPGVTPTTGSDANGQLTIATLQFAGWNKSDLSTYAADNHLPNPLTTSSGYSNGDEQFTQIPVGEASVPKATASEHGADEEVDLDQESILSTDQSANQRAYFSPNSSGASYVQDLAKVLADVTQGQGHSNDGGDPKIAALSTSWGSCEAEFSEAFHGASINAVEGMLTSLTAAGVTVFAAAGDDGVYDCGDSSTSTRIGVDYPASSPAVVAVGGTRLHSVGAKKPNTGKNWTDAAWTCTSAQVCEGFRAGDTGGTGGGESSLKQFAMPAYQKAGIGNEPFTTSTGKKGNFGTQPRRLVPDISADGDPDSGFGVLTTDPTDACANSLTPSTCKQSPPPTTIPIGGTSLSSPVSAALFTDLLGAHGATAGLGDIHDALYSAYAAGGAFRDVTTGSNGSQANVDRHAAAKTAAELPVKAQKGYDTLSGLGTPLWPAIAPYLFTPKPPVAKAALAMPSAHSAKHADRLRVRWHGDQSGSGGLLPASARLTVIRKGTKAAVYHRAGAAAKGSHLLDARPGDYVETLTEKSLGGQQSKPATAETIVPFDDRTFTFHGDWSRVDSRTSFAGSSAVTDSAGASATTSHFGHLFYLWVDKGPTLGELAIYHGHTRIGTYNLHSAHARQGLVNFYSAPHNKRRTFTFRYLGKKAANSHGTAVDVDALYVFR